MSATEHSECSTVLLLRHNFILIRKSTQNTQESILQWVKDATPDKLRTASCCTKKTVLNCLLTVSHTVLLLPEQFQLFNSSLAPVIHSAF